MKNYDVIIIGGGAIGSSIAYSLSKRNKRVAIIEKQMIGSGASSAAAGLLGVQAEWDAEDPLFHLAQKSRRLFPKLQEEIRTLSGIDIGYEQKGILRIAHTEQELARIHDIMNWQSACGEVCEAMTMTQVQQIEPAVSSKLYGGVFCRDDGHVLAKDLTKGYAASAAALGCDIYEHTEVTQIIEQQGEVCGVQTTAGMLEAKQIILATGASNQPLQQHFEIEAIPVKGEVVCLHSYEPILQVPLFRERFYIAPKRGGHYVIGATMKRGDVTKHVEAASVQHLLNQAFELVPALQQATFKTSWAGLRPDCSLERPLMAQHATTKRLWCAVGHYRNGILLSAITGEYMANQLEEVTNTCNYV